MVAGLAWNCGIPLPALALDPPGEGEITFALAAELPAWWHVQSIEITSSVNEGDDVSPRYRQRFVADAFSREDLYLAVTDAGRIGPFTILITTNPAAEGRRLYGTATSVVALGKWSTELALENSVRGVGQPRSLYEGPVIVAGDEQTGRIAERFLQFHALSKTVAEGVVRSAVSSEALEKLSADERAALEEASQARLAALKQRYERERERIETAHQTRLAALVVELEEEAAALERRKTAVGQAREQLVADGQRFLDDLVNRIAQERAALAAAVEHERKRMEAKHRDKIAALSVELDQESAEVDEMAAALAEERRLLIEENQTMLDALRSEYERERAGVTAEAKMLDAIARTEAETEAQQKLATALAALNKEKIRIAESADKARAAEIADRKARYDGLVAKLGSDDATERTATLDVILASDDDELKNFAIAATMKSDDMEQREFGIKAALRSGNDDLQGKALAALVSEASQFGVVWKEDEGDQKGRTLANDVFKITSFNRETLTFSGSYDLSWAKDVRMDGQRGPRGSGVIHGDTLTLTLIYFRRGQNQPSQCTMTAQVDDKGTLKGKIVCGGSVSDAEVVL